MTAGTAAPAEPQGTCRWCGQVHGVRCLIVKAMEYHPDGTVRRVEFYSPADYVQPLGACSPGVPLPPTTARDPPAASYTTMTYDGRDNVFTMPGAMR